MPEEYFNPEPVYSRANSSIEQIVLILTKSGKVKTSGPPQMLELVNTQYFSAQKVQYSILEYRLTDPTL
jgi:hypothetical protein